MVTIIDHSKKFMKTHFVQQRKRQLQQSNNRRVNFYESLWFPSMVGKFDQTGSSL